MTSFRARSIYGFSASDYQLAVKTEGEIPTISAADLPPRFQQYVIVEVTIDVDGRVGGRPHHGRNGGPEHREKRCSRRFVNSGTTRPNMMALPYRLRWISLSIFRVEAGARVIFSRLSKLPLHFSF